jgi:hypothetical protein
MKVVLTILLFIVGIFAALAIGGGLLVLLAYGVGWVLNLVMHLEPFQVTIITLGGMLAFGILAERIWEGITSAASGMPNSDEDDDNENEYDDEEEPLIVLNPRIPRWRQPLKNVDFSNTKPDEHCPCGSGRKYKNCHGRKQIKT